MVDNRTSVSRFLSNTRTRKMVDQAVDPDVALLKHLFLKFKDSTFNEIDRPNNTAYRREQPNRS